MFPRLADCRLPSAIRETLYILEIALGKTHDEPSEYDTNTAYPEPLAMLIPVDQSTTNVTTQLTDNTHTRRQIHFAEQEPTNAMHTRLLNRRNLDTEPGPASLP